MRQGGSTLSFDYAQAYKLMYLIRRTEEEIVTRYSRDELMRCPTHLSIGQEAAAVGVMMALGPDDKVYGYHRSHAHYLAKGGDLEGMIAELHGKVTGCTGGWGGSMHLADESVGFSEASTAVGDGTSLAAGSALAFKLDGSDRTAVAFFGDSAVETGQFWEAANFAAAHQLPMLFVCENNLYSVATHVSLRQPDKPIHERVKGFMWSEHVDDGDVAEVCQAAKRCRNARPGFLEISTYRYREHVGPNFDWDQGFRTKEEVLEHMQRDSLNFARGKVAESAVVTIEDGINRDVLSAFSSAESAPWPEAIKT